MNLLELFLQPAQIYADHFLRGFAGQSPVRTVCAKKTWKNKPRSKNNKSTRTQGFFSERGEKRRPAGPHRAGPAFVLSSGACPGGEAILGTGAAPAGGTCPRNNPKEAVHMVQRGKDKKRLPDLGRNLMKFDVCPTIWENTPHEDS